MKGKLARHSLQTSAWLVARVATQALTLVLLTRLLGPSIYGKFAAVASLAVVMGLLPNLGAGFVMLARSARSETGISEVWRYAWPLTLTLGILLLVAYVAAATFITDASLPISTILAVGAAELVLTPFTILCSFALQANERVPLSQCVQWLPLILRALVALPCYWLTDTQRLPVYVVLQFFASLMGAGIGLWITSSLIKLDWRPRWASRKELGEGASYAAMNVVAANPTELDKIVAVRLVGSYEAGVYTATARIMAATVMPVIGMLLASQPRLFRHAHDQTREGARLIGLIGLLAVGWGIISGLLLALCSPMLPWLFGASYVSMARLMPWLSAVAPFLSLRLSAGTIMVAFGRPMGRIAFELCGICTLVLGMLVLTPRFGIQGIAIALVISEAGMSAIGWLLVRRYTTER